MQPTKFAKFGFCIFSHLCPHRILTVNSDFPSNLPWHVWEARGQWTMAVLGPETCWDYRVQPITCVSEEVKNEFRDILKVEKRRHREQATRALNYLLSQNLRYLEDGPLALQFWAWVPCEHTCIRSVLVSLHFRCLIWCLQPCVHIFTSLGTIYYQACLDSKTRFQFQKTTHYLSIRQGRGGH